MLGKSKKKKHTKKKQPKRVEKKCLFYCSRKIHLFIPGQGIVTLPSSYYSEVELYGHVLEQKTKE